MAKLKSKPKKEKEPEQEENAIFENSIMVTPEGEELIIVQVDMINKIVYAKGHHSPARWFNEAEVKTWERK